MADAIVADLVKSIAVNTGSSIWGKLVSAADIDSQIRELQNIRNTIEATLLDADLEQGSSSSKQDVLEKLERGLAKIIDFQDAKAAKAKQKQIMGGSNLSKKVRTFFSTSNQLISPFKDARKIKTITEELSFVARNHAQFGSILSSSTLNKNRELSNESGSHTNTDMVIGRDGDRDKIVSSLLESSSAAGILSAASIVGIGGAGKTTLAQYVYNDERITCFDLRLWVFTSQDFNVKDILRKIVSSATYEEPLDYDMDQLQHRLIRAIAGKRFLLVLDNVWDQDSLRAEWLHLRSLLSVGAQGSKVLITTRTDTVARMMGTQDPYIISDLGDEDSWLLFQHVAMTEWHEPGVEAIGKKIVKMCPKVPLVIRVIGSLLAGMHTVQEWRTFRDDQLTSFASYGHDVISTLKLSYDNLSVALKLCVTYCSLFPKGFLYEKSQLIHLWISMGYIGGEHTNQNLEGVAEGYVLGLLKRGFFHCKKRVGYECPNSFWMHNLMHDLILSVAGFKYKMADSSTTDFDERVCHVSYVSAPDLTWKPPSSLFKIKHLKSFLLPLPTPSWGNLEAVRIFPVHDKLISTVQSLRALRMHGLSINKLPRSLGELIHLSYLDFSFNPVRKLPNSITQLVNLYLLNLSNCWNLEELPKDIGKLAMLRHLNLYGCLNMCHLPKGLLRLTGLKTLGHFVVGKPGNSLRLVGSKVDLVCGLADLDCFDNLKGWLTIDLIYRSKEIVSEAKAANLDRKEKITDICMRFRGSAVEDEMVLDNLKPGTNLKSLHIDNFAGKRLPHWMREGIHIWLPNLVQVHISECNGCIYLCSLGRLPRLKILSLENLDKVEYIENSCSSCSSNANKTIVLVDGHPSTPLFPSLEILNLRNMPALKGWWNVTDIAHDQGLDQVIEWMPAFPKLDEVAMDMELVLSLAEVLLQRISSLQYLCVTGKHIATSHTPQTLVPSDASTTGKQPVILLKTYLPMLRELQISETHIEFLYEEFRGMLSLETLTIGDCKFFEALPTWIDSLSSLRKLTLWGCPRLKSLPHEISNLPNLESLLIHKCSRQLVQRCQQPTGEDWPKIQHILNITITPTNDVET